MGEKVGYGNGGMVEIPNVYTVEWRRHGITRLMERGNPPLSVWCIPMQVAPGYWSAGVINIPMAQAGDTVLVEWDNRMMRVYESEDNRTAALQFLAKLIGYLRERGVYRGFYLGDESVDPESVIGGAAHARPLAPVAPTPAPGGDPEASDGGESSAGPGAGSQADG